MRKRPVDSATSWLLMSGVTQAQRLGLLCCATCVMLLGAALAAGLRVDHSAALQWYDHQIVTHPIRTKSLTAGLISALGDLICQHVVEERQAETLATVAQAGGTLKARLAKPIYISWKRVARFAACGCCLSGPVYHFWFQLLSEHLPKPSTAVLLGMVAADQLLLAPPFNTLFLSVLYGIEALELHGFGLLCVRTVRGRVFGSWCDIMKMNYSALHATLRRCPTKMPAVLTASNARLHRSYVATRSNCQLHADSRWLPCALHEPARRVLDDNAFPAVIIGITAVAATITACSRSKAAPRRVVAATKLL